VAFEGLAQSIIGTLERGQVRRENEMMRKRAERRQRTAELANLVGTVATGIQQTVQNRKNQFQLNNARSNLINQVYGKEFLGTQEGAKEPNPYYKEAKKTRLLEKLDEARQLMYQKATAPEGFYTKKTKYTDYATGKEVVMSPSKRLRSLQRDINTIAGPNSGLASIWQQQQIREQKLDQDYFAKARLPKERKEGLMVEIPGVGKVPFKDYLAWKEHQRRVDADAARAKADAAKAKAAGKEKGVVVDVPGVGKLPFNDYLKYAEHQRKIKADEATAKGKALAGVEAQLKRPMTIPDEQTALADYERFVVEDSINDRASSHMRLLPRGRKSKITERVVKGAWKNVAESYIRKKNKINELDISATEQLARKMTLLIDMVEELEDPVRLNERIADPIAKGAMSKFALNPDNWRTGETGVQTATEAMKNVVLARMKAQGLTKDDTEDVMDYMENIVDRYAAILKKEHRGAKIGDIYDWDPDSEDVKDEIAAKFTKNKNFRALIPTPATYGKGSIQLALDSVLNDPKSDPERFWGLVLYARAQGYLNNDPNLKDPNDTRFGGWNNEEAKQVIREAILGTPGNGGAVYEQHFPNVVKAYRKKMKAAVEEAEKQRRR